MEADVTDYCSDCKRVTQVVDDHSVGDSICIVCGLVLHSHIPDDTAEWRTFANDDGHQDADPVRVGAPSNPFLDGLDSTIMHIPFRDKSTAVQISRTSISPVIDKSRASLVSDFAKIGDFCDRLGVNKIVKDLACDIYSKIRPFRLKIRRDNSLVVACVHIACQKQNQSRTLNEMAMETGVPKKRIVTEKNSIMKLLNEEFAASSVTLSMELGTTGTDKQVNDYLKRFAYQIGLNNRAIKAAQEILKNSEQQYIRRTPKSVAAGIIYVTCLLCGHKRTVREISQVASTSEGTIKKAYNDLHPYLSCIVPSWFACKSELDKLHAP